MLLSLIVAVAENRVIGRAGQLPWRLSADLRRFKRITMGHTLIMGRKTYESIGRPLPGRRSIVISSRPDFRPPGCDVADSWSAARQRAEDADEAFVIGGQQVFAAALPDCRQLHWTHVHATVPGDVYFPEIDWQAWRQVSDEKYPADERNEYAYSFRVYRRADD